MIKQISEKIYRWIQKNYIFVIIFIIVEAIILSVSQGIWHSIENYEVSTYSLETNYQERLLVADENSKIFNLDIHDNQLFNLDIVADNLEGSGEIEWFLHQENEKNILSGQLNETNFSGGRFSIPIDQNILQNGKKYQIELEPLNDTSCQIFVDDNNFIKATYYYTFQYEDILKNILIIMNVAIAIIMIILMCKISIYIKYWIIAVSTGLLSIVIVIPFSTADEFRHFARAYSVANGEFVCQYDEQGNPYVDVPANLYNLRYIAPVNSVHVADETNFVINISSWLYYLKCEDTSEIVSTWVGGTYAKGIFDYLPQAAAMGIGKILGLKQVWLFYLSRMGNWFAAAVIWFLIIKIVPKHKSLFVTLYCMPTNIVYASTSSTDGLLNALVGLMLAIVIKCYFEHIELINKRVLPALLIITTYIAIIKLPYILVIYFFVALDPLMRFEKGKWKRIVQNVAIVTGICIVGYILSHVLTGWYIPNTGGGSDKEHIMYMVNHIFDTMSIFIKAFFGDMDSYYRQALSVNSFGISILVLPYTMLMLYAGAADRGDKTIKPLQTTVMTLTCAALWGSVLLALYLCTPIGADYIGGVQGRYMCPVIMMGAVIMALLQIVNIKTEGKFVSVYCMFIMVIAFFDIIQIQWI